MTTDILLDSCRAANMRMSEQGYCCRLTSLSPDKGRGEIRT
jgi:hypothetical protein